MITIVENEDFTYYQYSDKELCLLAFSLASLIKQVRTIYNIDLLTQLN